MNTDELGPLKTVAAAVFQKEQISLAQIVKEEQELRRSLIKLGNAASPLFGESPDATHGLRASGAEAAWQVWVEAKTTELNTRLAQVLARKSIELERARSAFGRCEALRLLDLKARARDDLPD